MKIDRTSIENGLKSVEMSCRLDSEAWAQHLGLTPRLFWAHVRSLGGDFAKQNDGKRMKTSKKCVFSVASDLPEALFSMHLGPHFTSP